MAKEARNSIQLDFQAVFDASLDAGFIHDSKGRILTANRTAVARYGYNLEELKLMQISDLATPELRARVPKKLIDLPKTGDIFEWAHQCKDGTKISVEVFAQPVVFNGGRVVLASVRDISQRKKLESELQSKQHFLEHILDTEPGTVYIYDLMEQCNVYVNRHWLTAFGYSPEEMQAMGVDVVRLFHPDDLTAIKASHEAWRRGSMNEIRVIEYRVRDKQGEWHWLMSRETPFSFDGSGQVSQILGIANDITVRKQVESDRDLFVSLANNSKEFIAIADLDLEPMYLNRAALELVGLPDLETALKLKGTDFFFPEDRALIVNEFLPQVLRQGGSEVETRFRHFETGAAIWILCNVFAVHNTKGQVAGWATVSRDITERRHAEMLLEGQRQVLEMIATGSSLAKILTQLMLLIEAQSPGMLGSILLLDVDGTHVRHGAAPSLPAEYIAAVDGQAIGPVAGSCGTAAYRKEQVFVEDIASDPLWENYRAIALPHGLRACWSTPMLDEHGQVLGTFAMYYKEPKLPDPEHLQLIDTTVQAAVIAINRHQSEQTLRQSEARYRLLFEHAPNGILIADTENYYLDANTSACQMFGYSRDELVGMRVSDTAVEDETQNFDATLQAVRANTEYQREWYFRRKGGTVFPAEVVVTTMPDGNLLGVIRDITERKQSEERITYLANYDALTGLPNRSQLNDHLKYAISLAKRHNGRLAVMFIDLDRFKDINDTLGHSIGDTFLIEMSKRLQLVLREEDTVARLGGDEFILMLPNSNARGVAKVAQKVLEIISVPCRVEQYDLSVTASIGIAIYPDDGVDLETLSKSADTAMYRAKQEGRDGYRFFTAEMQAHATRSMQLVIALRQALKHDQMRVHYQPQISIDDGRVIGVEALLRWQHPEMGEVSPAEFIPVAEDSGLILSIGEWVLSTAVRQLKQWMNMGCAPIVVAVNLSAIQFRHPSLPEMVTRILEAEQLSPEFLELELTEGVAMYDPKAAIEIMNTLHELGIRMSIDDFGTGYSSLNYLKKFKVYKLKVDQSFVYDINTDMEDRAIVAAIIGMSKNLGLRTIAEGVETAEQLAYLREQGCDEAQGYYYSKPLPAEQLDAMLSNNSV